MKSSISLRDLSRLSFTFRDDHNEVDAIERKKEMNAVKIIILFFRQKQKTNVRAFVHRTDAHHQGRLR